MVYDLYGIEETKTVEVPCMTFKFPTFLVRNIRLCIYNRKAEIVSNL